jgi:hypothetical protein
VRDRTAGQQAGREVHFAEESRLMMMMNMMIDTPASPPTVGESPM